MVHFLALMDSLENTKKIQDSLYYQDYSYIIRVGESISNWRDSLKSAIHPAGFYFGGEVNIVNRVNNRMKTGFTRLSGLTETDEVIEILSVIFDEKIGRRLGTPTDGSSLRTNPELAIEADASFTASTRATTVNQEFKLKLGQDNNHTLRSLTATRGIGIYSGPTLNTINNLASTAFDHTPDRILLNTSADENDGLLLEDGGDIKQEFGLRDMDSGITIAILNNIKLFGTGNSTLDNNAARFEEFNNASKIKTSFAIPCQIRTTIS